MKSVYLLATLDTKGAEADWVRQTLQQAQLPVTLVDAGCLGEPTVPADVSRAELFQAAGVDYRALQQAGDRGAAIHAAAQGAAQLVSTAHQQGRLLGVLGLGGSAGTTIGTAAMRALPLGIPKIMVSTMASGDVRGFVQHKDIAMLYSVVDIAGLNRICRQVLSQAAAMMAGAVQHGRPAEPIASDLPVIAATMFGVTTPCIERARQILEQAGFEVLVFHATGTGGQTMESLIEEGWIQGVLDITTTELADELVGGVLSAGPHRLQAAVRRGIPQVVSVGALDMVNFWAMETVPATFRQRLLYRHNDHVTLMRTTVAENEALGRRLGEVLSQAPASTRVLLPARGVSALDRVGQPFDDPAARQALFAAVRASAGTTPVVELDAHINDDAFATQAAETLLALLRLSPATPTPARNSQSH